MNSGSLTSAAGILRAMQRPCLLSVFWEELWLGEKGQLLGRPFNKFIIKIMGAGYGQLGWLLLGSI